MLLDRHKRVETAIDRIRSKFLQKDEMVISRRNITLSNYTNGAAANLVGGNFFTGFLLLQNADDAFIGLMTAIMLMGNLLQVLSPLLLERFSSRKRLLISIRISFYLFNIVLIGIIPYLGFAENSKLMAVVIAQVAISLINAVSAPGFAIWHIKSIPEAIRAKYYSMLTISNPIITYILILSASAVADRFKAAGDALQGLLVLRIIALGFAGMDIYFLFKVKEYPNRQENNHATMGSILLSPFKEKKYMLTVWISCLWSFTANIPGPFFSIYLLRELGISYSYINLINMLNIPVLLLLTPLWARRIQYTSWFGTLSVSMGFYVVSYLGLSFVNSNTLYLYPVFMIIAFIFAPGINLTFANIPYINIPENNQTRYIGFYLTMNSLAALIATVLGRNFIILTAPYRINLLGTEMQNKQYILLVTAVLMLLAAITISRLRKKAEERAENQLDNR